MCLVRYPYCYENNENDVNNDTNYCNIYIRLYRYVHLCVSRKCNEMILMSFANGLTIVRLLVWHNKDLESIDIWIIVC